MRVWWLIPCGILALASPVLAQQTGNTIPRSAELALSNQTIELRYRAPSAIGGQPNSEVNYAVFLSEARDIVVSAALLFDTNLDFGRFQVRLGPQVYAALLEQENNDVFSLAVGGQVRYEFVRSRKIAIVGSGYWAPDVLTFGQADNIKDFTVRGEMQLADRFIGFVGYRWFELDLLMGETQKLQNELFAGINWELR
jgi:hypothetical protein